MSATTSEFWKAKSLNQMSDDEWELLCDGCGKCCLVKLENADTGQIHNTSIACKLLDTETCRCSDYKHRKSKVPGCLVLRPLTQYLADLLPGTCAYRLLDEGKELPDWHPLVSGNCQSVIDAGISVAGRVIPEQFVHPDELEDFVIGPEHSSP